MYLSTVRATAPPGAHGRFAVPVSGTVVGLGLVSMFTDISAEMVTAVLPMYLIYGVGVGYAQLGVIDGLYTGATAVLRLAGGYLADRLGRPKAVAAAGYAISAVSKLGLPLAGASLTGIGVAIAADRAGKGIRTAPRDAMISAAVPKSALGRAFGLHRTLDTAGALLGPIVAFALVAGLSTGYQPVFVTSFGLAVVGLLILGFFVNAPRTVLSGQSGTEPRVDLRAGLGVLRQRFLRRATIAAALLGVCTVGDMFLYVALQQQSGLPVAVLPLLPLGTALVFMLAASPIGRAADRYGRWHVFLAGHAILIGVYLLLATGSGWPVVALALLGHGLFYATTDGVLMACAAPLIPLRLRATGLAMVQTAQALARAMGSVLFGLLAAAATLNIGFAVFIAALIAALGLAFHLGREQVT